MPRLGITVSQDDIVVNALARLGRSFTISDEIGRLLTRPLLSRDHYWLDRNVIGALVGVFVDVAAALQGVHCRAYLDKLLRNAIEDI